MNLKFNHSTAVRYARKFRERLFAMTRHVIELIVRDHTHRKHFGRASVWTMGRFGILVLVMLVGLMPSSWAMADGDDGLARLEPAQGVYFGVSLRWDQDSLADFRSRLGHGPAVAVRFFCLPLCEGEAETLEAFISQVALQKGTAMLTFEPYQGLAAVTPEVADAIALQISAYNGAGVPIFLRFAHEMNGSWYPWSQSPAEYRATYRMLAEAIRRRAPMTALVWAPNYGGGYPFHGGTFEAQPGSTAFDELDTNDDGMLNMADDMYAPYYPGDDVVDWVGMSLYHWGSAYPWRENEIPEAGKFVAQLHGEYDGLNGDDSAVPDFYQDYGITRGKPIAIPETAAMYNTEIDGADEVVIKQTWWRQVFSDEIFTDHPQIKMINWFEVRKQESEIQNSIVNWGVTLAAETLLPFKQDLSTEFLLFAADVEEIHRTYMPSILHMVAEE